MLKENERRISRERTCTCYLAHGFTMIDVCVVFLFTVLYLIFITESAYLPYQDIYSLVLVIMRTVPETRSERLTFSLLPLKKRVQVTTTLHSRAKLK